MLTSPRLALACLALFAPVVASSADGNAAKGRRAFATQCAACHATTAENRLTGPGLQGIVGRKAASTESFAYSDALKKSALTWDIPTLEKYLAAPTQFVPGTTMTQAVTAPAARADLLAFLNTLTPASTAEPVPSASAPAK